MKTVSVRRVSRIELVKDQVLDWIRRQQLRPGDRILSENQIADLLGFGAVTVHKAMRELAAEGVVCRRQGQGTFVSGTRVRAVGIIACCQERKFFKDPYFSNVMAGISTTLQARNIPFAFKQVGEGTGLERDMLDLRVDGILALGNGLYTRLTRELRSLARQLPLVAIAGTPEEETLNAVSSDHRQDSFQAVDRLIRAGHRRWAVFAGQGTRERLRGFRQAMAAHKLRVDERLVFQDPGPDLSGTIATILAAKPDAIFDALGSIVGNKVLPDLLRAGLRVTVAAYDDFQGRLAALNVPHIVIRQPMERIGNVAAEQLLGLIDGRIKPPIRILFPSELEMKVKSSR